MTRFLPYPVLSAFLVAMWLLLNQSLSLGQILLGCVVGVAGGLAISSLQIPAGGIHRPLAIIRLAFIVLADIIRSNIAVAQIVLFGKKANSGFVKIKLDLQNEYGLAILACIVTSTPGTIWVNYDSGKGILVLHILDLIEGTAWNDLIKNRYERLLMEIFE